LPSASGVLVSNTIRVHRILSRVRDDRERPLSGTGRNGYAPDLGILENRIFLLEGLDKAVV
jgi:hypothetical protein